ncbi:MAG TPA: CHRD domain-containing protein [Saprospiraceae bacterium]
MNRIVFFLLICLMAFFNQVRAEHLSSHLQFSARMSGSQEVPEVVSDAQGVAVFTLDKNKTTIYFNVSLNNLSGPITGMHIHEAPAGTNGPVIINLVPFLNGNRAKGALKNITPATISKLLNGDYYINVHTEMNPGGEIRGQIHLETDSRYTALMSGANEVPAVTTDGKGLGVFQLNQSQTSVKFKVLFFGLTSDVVGAHIHNAPAGVNGPVIFDLAPFIFGNSIEGVWEPGAMLDALLAGELYINVHTVNNPGGEIRAQLTVMPGMTFDAALDGDQENPPVERNGRGLGIITIAPDLATFQYYILYDSLSGSANDAHFHLAAPGVNGPVAIDISDDIDDSNRLISGTQPLNLDILNNFLSGGYYINIHTDENPGGEIRGQVYRFAREGYTFELNGGQEAPSVTTTGTGAGLVSIDRDQSNAHYMLVVSGLTGEFTASHFHNGKPGVSGGVIHNITSSFNDFGGAYGYWDETSAPPFDAGPLFRSGEVYVNVHTDLFPGGEIRGNIIRSSELFGELPFDPQFSDDLILRTVLVGDQENPPVTTDAIGLATVFFEADKSTAKVNISSKGLSGPITGVHIHEGDFGNNGPVLFPLTNVGNRIQNEITDITPIDLISLMNGGTYVNIHTANNPGGEIRGQLQLDQDITFLADLNGENESPVVVTDGLGLAAIHYTVGQLAIEINAQLTGLSSEITGVHLHTGAPGENGPVIIDLGDYRDGNRISGRLEVTVENLNDIFSGNVYINVHTTNNPAGEIRGQMNFLPGITFDGWMSGMQEVPFTNSSASGLAVSTIYPGLTDIALWMLVDGASGPIAAAHFHQAPLQSNGGVVHDLTGDLNGNSILHLGVVDDGLLSALLTGDIYINAHTAAYPGGELRGQMFRRARDGYGFDLCTAQELGTIDAPDASGTGFVSISRNHENISIHVLTDGLTDDLTASHIHEAPIGVNGGVIVDLTAFYNDGVMVINGATTDTALINTIRAGNTYINVHTALHPGGEIRGQIVKDFLCELETGIRPLEDVISEVTLSPVPVVDILNITMQSHLSTSLQFSIADAAGQLISTEKINLVSGENTLSLITNTLLPGFYILVITDGDATQAYKFVK